MGVIKENIIENYKRANHSDTFVVHKYTLPGGCNWHSGFSLLRIQLSDQDWLDIHKLSTSSGFIINSDEIKAKAFPFCLRYKK
jgi:hypothetical protein